MHLIVFETLINRNTDKCWKVKCTFDLAKESWQVWSTQETKNADFLAVALFVTWEQFNKMRGPIHNSSEKECPLLALQNKLRGIFTTSDNKVKDVRVMVIKYSRGKLELK